MTEHQYLVYFLWNISTPLYPIQQMGFIKRTYKKFEYKPRYYKGDGNPYEMKHKFDQFRSTTGKNKGLKTKIVSAVNELKGDKDSIEFNNEVYELESKKSNSGKIILFIILILVLVFLFIINFDLSIFLGN